MLPGNDVHVKVTPSWDIICCDSLLGVDTSNQGYADISLGLDYIDVETYTNIKKTNTELHTRKSAYSSSKPSAYQSIVSLWQRCSQTIHYVFDSRIALSSFLLFYRFLFIRFISFPFVSYSFWMLFWFVLNLFYPLISVDVSSFHLTLNISNSFVSQVLLL